MADNLLRCSADKAGKELSLKIERRTDNNSWAEILSISPDIRIFGQDTLNLDIFVPHLFWQKSKKNKNEFILTGEAESAKLTTKVTVHSFDMLRVETVVNLLRSARLEMAVERMKIKNFPVERSWNPYITPEHECVMGDFAFRSPAVGLESKGSALAIIPNLKFLESSRKVPTALNFDSGKGKITFGCMPFRILHDSYFAHYDTDTVDLLRGSIKYSYYIFLRNGCREGGLEKQLSKVLWRLNGKTPAFSPKLSTSDLPTFQHPPKSPFKGGLDKKLQSAFGLALAAKRAGKKEKLEEIKKVKEEVLGAKWENGLFDNGVSFDFPETQNRTRLADLSWACYWLCRWNKEIESDNGVLYFAKKYAEKLLSMQRHGGFFPAWVDSQTGKTARLCVRSAETAVHAIFLNELNKWVPDSSYIKSARRAVNFVIRKVIKKKNWENSESYFEADASAKVRKQTLKYKPSHVLSMWWSAKALLNLHNTTTSARYLSWGRHALDELSLYQQLWSPRFCDKNLFGGFGSSNASPFWNYSAQAGMAETFLDYYEVCGLTEYFSRGIAALHAAFALEDEENNIAPSCKFENPVLPIQVLTPGNAYCEVLQPAEEIFKKYGDLYVDIKRQHAFGINGIIVESVQLDLAGLAVYGREVLGKTREITVRTSSGNSFKVKLKKDERFEIQI